MLKVERFEKKCIFVHCTKKYNLVVLLIFRKKYLGLMKTNEKLPVFGMLFLFLKTYKCCPIFPKQRYKHYKINDGNY